MLNLTCDPQLGELAPLAGRLAALDDAGLRADAAGLLDEAVALARAAGRDELRLDAEPAGATLHDVVSAAGFRMNRDLLQLRRPLPLSEHTDLPVRAFEVGRDEWAWLEVNNRAFAWHPEQAGWSVADIRTRQLEPWFDPAGFLLHERDGRLAGFCWTKVHHDTDPPLGEIYVIAVDPDFHGLGIGRALAVAGLEWLAGQGLSTAMLYVESDNEAALGLYRAMGFTPHLSHRWYRLDLTAAPAQAPPAGPADPLP